MRRLPLGAALAVVLLTALRAGAGEVVGTVLTPRPTVVALEPETPGPSRAPRTFVMDQKNLAFVPFVVPVLRGDTVEFTNSDDVQHNVFSPSTLADKFDLGTYGPGGTRTVTFARAGDVVILCNVHMEMEGHVLVLETPYFATAADGRFRIIDVPAGRYRVRLWRGGWLPDATTVDVPATGTASLELAGRS